MFHTLHLRHIYLIRIFHSVKEFFYVKETHPQDSFLLNPQYIHAQYETNHIQRLGKYLFRTEQFKSIGMYNLPSSQYEDEDQLLSSQDALKDQVPMLQLWWQLPQSDSLSFPEVIPLGLDATSRPMPQGQDEHTWVASYSIKHLYKIMSMICNIKIYVKAHIP